ncbi:MAG: hypothetical protein QOJ09_2022, partial [Actinomycetota bacterium]|nr:hypothetical protein [Actinomycetota bacterium]
HVRGRRRPGGRAAAVTPVAEEERAAGNEHQPGRRVRIRNSPQRDE